MTHALLVTLATWARALPGEQVARLFRCSWGTVATAVEEAVAVGLAHRDRRIHSCEEPLLALMSSSHKACARSHATNV